MSVATIWKYEWPMPRDRAIFDMPRGAEVLSASEQFGGVAIWARVDPHADKEERKFAIVATGGAAPLAFEGKFIGTALLANGRLVLHVFECLDPRQ